MTESGRVDRVLIKYQLRHRTNISRCDGKLCKWIYTHHHEQLGLHQTTERKWLMWFKWSRFHNKRRTEKNINVIHKNRVYKSVSHGRCTDCCVHTVYTSWSWIVDQTSLEVEDTLKTLQTEGLRNKHWRLSGASEQDIKPRHQLKTTNNNQKPSSDPHTSNLNTFRCVCWTAGGQKWC